MNHFSLLHSLCPLKLLGPLLFLFSFSAYSQQEGRMETDRPDQTECPYIVKTGYFQAEMGFNKNHEDIGFNYALPSTLLKYGLSKSFELRYVSSILYESHISFQHEAIGFKVRLAEPRKFIPRTSLIVHYNLRDEKRDVSDKNPLPHSLGQAVFTLQHEVYKELGMGYNFGVELHENGHAEGIYRISPGINLGKKGYAYAEVFGRLPATNVTDHWFDGGIAYYISDHLKVDVSSGKSFSSNHDWYLAFGMSFRGRLFHRSKSKS